MKRFIVKIFLVVDGVDISAYQEIIIFSKTENDAMVFFKNMFAAMDEAPAFNVTIEEDITFLNKQP